MMEEEVVMEVATELPDETGETMLENAEETMVEAEAASEAEEAEAVTAMMAEEEVT